MKFKKVLALLLSLTLIMSNSSMVVLAETADINTGKETPVSSGVCGTDAKYNKYADGTLEIYGEGAVASYAFEDDDTITNLIVKDGITAIGEWAFYDCDSLTSVLLSNTVSSIASRAFYSCGSFDSITILNPECEICNSVYTMPLSSTIIGYVGSTAESFAKLYSIEFLEYCLHENTFTVPAIEETCYTDGSTEGLKCDDCKRLLSGCEFVAGGHIDKNTDSFCDRCEKTMPESSGVCLDAVKYYMYADGTLEIYGEGVVPSKAFYNQDDIQRVIIHGGITEIGKEAFDSCDYLTSVVLQEGVTTIGESAFRYCRSLESVTIPEGVTTIGKKAFYSCALLNKIELPKTLTSIGEYAFYCCSSLKEIVIPEGVTSIAAGAFYGCSSLEKVELPKEVTTIGDHAFYNCSSLDGIELPESVTNIGEYAFYGCSSLRVFTLPEELTAIKEYSFYGCSSLQEIEIPENVTSIEERAFDDCDGITEVVIPEAVNYIGDGAFASGTYKYVTILNPECDIHGSYYTFGVNVTIIGHVGSTAETYAEMHGRKFWKYCLHENTTLKPEQSPTCHKDGYTGGEYCDDCGRWLSGHNTITGTHYDENDDNICDRCAREMPIVSRSCGQLAEYYKYADGTLEIYGQGAIWSEAFENDDTITKVIVFEGITEIGESAFYHCDNLTSVILPEGVTMIGDRTFESCSGLGTITIPDSVTSIGQDAFSDCTRLVMHCGKGSVAETYCKDNGIYYVFSDVTDEENIVSGTRGTTVRWSLNKSTGKLLIETSGDMPSFANNAAPWKEYEIYVTSAEITGDCKNVGAKAFDGCRKLEHVTINDGVTIIEDSAFNYCEALKSVTLPESVETIGAFAFYECRSLERVYLPSKLKSIERNAFYYCVSLADIQLPHTLTSIGSAAFYQCESLKEIEIPEGISTINSSVFGYCSSLTSVKLPQTLISIFDNAFNHCSLTEIEIPYQVSRVSYNAFGNNANMKKIVFRNRNCAISDSFVLSSTTVVYGYENSTADTYATKNGFDFVAMDDGHEHNWVEDTEPASVAKDGYIKTICSGCGEFTTETIYRAVCSIQSDDYVYTGEGIRPGITVADNQGNPISEEYYEIIYPEESTDIGSYEVTVNFKGLYTGTWTKTFSITSSVHECKWDAGKILSEATCTERGSIKYICIVCDETKYEYPAAKGHTTEEIPAKIATCTEDGMTGGKRCSTCDAVLEKPTVIEASGHEYGSDYICDKCGYINEALKPESAPGEPSLPVEPDVPDQHICVFAEQITKATMEADGSIVEKCACGETKSPTPIYKIKSVNLEKTDVVYTGKAQKVKVTVKNRKNKKIADEYYTVTYKNNKNIGKATVTVKFKGRYSGTITKTFKINPAKPTIKRSFAGKNVITVKWKKGKKGQVTGYQVMAATNKKFTKNVKKTFVKGYSKTSKKMTKLKPKKAYYVRVRTYKTVKGVKYYSEWATIKKPVKTR